MHPARPWRPLALTMAVVLNGGCQTTPGPASDIRAQVVAVPLSRTALERGADQGRLHAALRAGATIEDAAAGRVVIATCALPGAESTRGVRHFSLTTVLPPGTTAASGTLLRLDAAGDSFESAPVDGREPAIHGRFRALGPAGLALDERQMVVWRLNPGDPPRQLVRCRPLDGEPGQVQAALFRTVRDDEMRFAAAEAARHAHFSDAELAAGAVVRVRCQLRVFDGGEWYSPHYLARAPAGLALRVGDVVRVRAGVDEGSRQPGPVGQVLAREGHTPVTVGRSAVDCRS